MTVEETLESGPRLTNEGITFVFPDPDHNLQAVRLYQELERPRNGPPFVYDDATRAWTVTMPVPDAGRVEYLIELVHADGHSETITDPHNPTVAGGAFGDKSVFELPGYRPPAWLGLPPAPDGTETTLEVPCRAARGTLPGILWSPPETDETEPLPLLVVHDGPEFGSLAALTVYLDRLVHSGQLPRFRAAIIGPRDRNQIYSASASYARSLTHEILPFLDDFTMVKPGRNMRIGMGASLGALAMLHAHRRSPVTFGALYLQSGSFFRQRFDKHESGFPRFRRISRFVGEVLATRDWAHTISVTITCGTIEENLANNRAVASALKHQGYDVKLVVNSDGHNWTGWRDTFDPNLTDLLSRMWS